MCEVDNDKFAEIVQAITDTYSSYDGDLLEEIHIGIGQEQEEETGVFYIVDVANGRQILHRASESEIRTMFNRLKEQI